MTLPFTLEGNGAYNVICLWKMGQNEKNTAWTGKGTVLWTVMWWHQFITIFLQPSPMKMKRALRQVLFLQGKNTRYVSYDALLWGGAGQRVNFLLKSSSCCFLLSQNWTLIVKLQEKNLSGCVEETSGVQLVQLILLKDHAFPNNQLKLLRTLIKQREIQEVATKSNSAEVSNFISLPPR